MAKHAALIFMVLIWLFGYGLPSRKRSLRNPLHIGSAHSISILELAQAVANVSTTGLNFTPEIKIANAPDNLEQFHQYVPSNSDTRSYLNVQEWTSLEAGIALMIKNSML